MQNAAVLDSDLKENAQQDIIADRSEICFIQLMPSASHKRPTTRAMHSPSESTGDSAITIKGIGDTLFHCSTSQEK